MCFEPRDSLRRIVAEAEYLRNLNNRIGNCRFRPEAVTPAVHPRRAIILKKTSSGDMIQVALHTGGTPVSDRR